ncbi:MAG: YihA family ribosome biogenesis GTP-binding protein [Helicobacter sp.]|nr:YihA family ribosome biogenesis GTP-binding protein [Helicobacter sp.]
MSYTLTKSEFVCSAQNLKECPPPLLSEVAFLGRSNVGKSSLINLLCNKKNLAKSSSTPGKTQLINYFLTEWKSKESQEILKIYFVDLPGFGYAKVSKVKKAMWNQHLVEFLSLRDSICLFIHLVDSRHPYLETDENLVKFLKQFLRGNQKILRIFTKFDKLNMSEQSKLKKKYPQALFSSILKKGNLEELREALISKTLGIS